ncbi:hypothetical protein C8Q79DRAFT_708655 [Trametes meyenii]|nr:hypothetical protein C8Q79DRAFT_708655 [Trametes meyenii]
MFSSFNGLPLTCSHIDCWMERSILDIRLLAQGLGAGRLRLGVVALAPSHRIPHQPPPAGRRNVPCDAPQNAPLHAAAASHTCVVRARAAGGFIRSPSWAGRRRRGQEAFDCDSPTIDSSLVVLHVSHPPATLAILPQRGRGAALPSRSPRRRATGVLLALPRRRPPEPGTHQSAACILGGHPRYGSDRLSIRPRCKIQQRFWCADDVLLKRFDFFVHRPARGVEFGRPPRAWHLACVRSAYRASGPSASMGARGPSL